MKTDGVWTRVDWGGCGGSEGVSRCEACPPWPLDHFIDIAFYAVYASTTSPAVKSKETVIGDTGQR